jgi:5'-nucleotidase
MLNRRNFLKKSMTGGGLLAVGAFPWESLAAAARQKLTILHTNDVHSRLEPFLWTAANTKDRGAWRQGQHSSGK